MKIKLFAMAIICSLALCFSLVACGGEKENDAQTPAGETTEEQKTEGSVGEGSAGETPEEQLARYKAGYQTMSDEFTISNPNPQNYAYVCETMGDEGEFVYCNEDYQWVPIEGEPVNGEEVGVSYSVEGYTGAVLVMWSTGKDYEVDNFSSISNTFE